MRGGLYTTYTNYFILYVGTNNLTTKQDPHQIAESIITLAVKIKRNCDVLIPIITARKNRYLRKVADVKRNLRDKSRLMKKNVHFINYGNAITVRHLNAPKLHLHKISTQVLSNQFADLFPT